MSAAAVEEGHNAGEGSHEGEAVQDGGEREQGEAGGVPLTPLGSPFGRAIIQMVDHDVLVEIARSQERMYVAAPSLNHHTLPHISTWSIAQSLGFPSLQWPSYPRYDCCVFAVHSSCRRPLVCSCTLWVKPQSHTSARRTHTRTRTQLPPTTLSPHLISLARSAANHLTGTLTHLTSCHSLALLPTTSQAQTIRKDERKARLVQRSCAGSSRRVPGHVCSPHTTSPRRKERPPVGVPKDSHSQGSPVRALPRGVCNRASWQDGRAGCAGGRRRRRRAMTTRNI
jgi:hypothetical protein